MSWKTASFFDKSVSKYKNTIKHFCFECMVILLRFLSCDLNRITHVWFVLWEKCKTMGVIAAITVYFFCLIVLAPNININVKVSISAFCGYFWHLFFVEVALVNTSVSIPFYKKMSIWYRERTGIISGQYEPVQTYGGGYITTYISPNCQWW